MSRHELIPVAYREPFAFGRPWCDERPHGETVLEIVRSVPQLPRQFLSRGIVCINGEEVPRELWTYVRPKPATDNLPIAVTLHWPLGSPGGGGRGTTKSIVGLVAAIALVAVTAGIATGFIGAGFVAATGVSAQVLAGAVGIVGALAISALTAPPTQDQSAQIGGSADINTDNKDPASASGNVLNPGGAIPRVIGTRKVFPPFICEPVVELVDEDEIVEAVLALNGPHLLEDLRVDGVSIADAEDIEFETLEGWSTDTPLTLVERQGRTFTPQITLSSHNLQENSLDLEHSDTASSPLGEEVLDDLPVWHGVISRNEPDEIWLHLLLPGGLAVDASDSAAIPLRIRMRLKAAAGSPVNPWINLPEVHFRNNRTQQWRLAILFQWNESPPSLVTVPSAKGFWYARVDVPAQDATPGPATPVDRQWDADSYFDDGAGDAYLNNGNEGSTRVRRINLYKNRLEVYLQEATFPRGIYEIEIKRGCVYDPASFSNASYNYAPFGEVRDFFWYFQSGSDFRIPQTEANYSHTVSVTRVVSIWNEPPVVGPDSPSGASGFALIALKATNRQIQRISVNASGYVRDLDSDSPAATWSSWVTTSNPAPHYVDVLSGDQNLDPLPEDLRDDAGLIEWRTLCIDNGWTCDAIIDDMRTQDVLALLASCAYAKPYQSDQYGVTVDNDKSADSPIQVFSRVNASNVRFERAFTRVPEAFVVGYRDEASDDDRAQTIVYQRDTSIATSGLFETITYDGLVETAKVEARAQFDLDQANMRSTFYNLDTDIESLVCRRGSLVALQHDVLSSRAGDAHIKTKTIVGPNITAFVLDSVIPITSGDTGIAIRRLDGTISTHEISNATGESDTITLTTPFADTAQIVGYDDTSDQYGSLVVAGPLASEYKRMLVLSITPQKDLKASLVLVDEAQELIRYPYSLDSPPP